jgi:thiol:disulfide interchange protein/DsbC/DsbD-like thiol-disulfide interchange protein
MADSPLRSPSLHQPALPVHDAPCSPDVPPRLMPTVRSALAFPARALGRTGAAFALAASLLLAATTAFAQFGGGSAGGNRVQVELIPEVTTARPGEAFWVALRMRIAPQWHTYWQNPGDSGLPTTLAWNLPAGASAGALVYPVPHRLPVGPLMNYGYEKEVVLLAQVTLPAAFGEMMLRASAQAEWLVCKDVCIPESATVGFQLPVAPVAASPDPRFQALFAQARSALPAAVAGWTASARVADGRLQIALRLPAGSTAPAGELYFFNAAEGQVDHARAQAVTRHRDGVLLEVPLLAQPPVPIERLAGVLVAAGGFGASLPPGIVIEAPLSSALADLGPRLSGATVSTSAAPGPGVAAPSAAAPAIGLIFALLLAFAGGLILNLMPCVFPVLSIKALSMVEQGARDPRGLRRNGLAFGAGVLLSFLGLAAVLLALRASGEQIGWGFQLQSPAFVAAMAVLFTLLALNLAGVFEIGLRLASAAGNVEARAGSSGSFMNGVLAVAVAAPCTAPFMGAALGYALVQPPAAALAVFAALALGMAAPYMLLCLVPALSRMLPPPGPWMVTFKQAMVFPLLGTVAWLTWVLGLQAGINAVLGMLAGLVLIACAAWIYGRFAGPTARPAPRAVALASTALFAVAGLYAAWPGENAQPAPIAQAHTAGDSLDWQPWSAARVAELRAQGRPVFIDFTAAWCVTCQANKRLVLDTAAVTQHMSERKVATLRADWTRRDRAITEALAGYGRTGIPVYVLYLPGRAQPILLPELLTRDIVLAALDQGSAPVAAAR